MTSASRSTPTARASGGKKLLARSVIQATGSPSLCASTTSRSVRVRAAVPGPLETSDRRPKSDCTPHSGETELLGIAVETGEVAWILRAFDPDTGSLPIVQLCVVDLLTSSYVLLPEGETRLRRPAAFPR